MDKKTAEELGGTLAQITASYDRKISDNAYGSVGVFFSATLDVAPGADPDEAMDALFAWVKAAAVRNAREPFEDVIHNTADAEPTIELPRTQTKGDPPEGGQDTIYKFEAVALPEDKYQLIIYPVLGNGKDGQYPLLKYTATSKQEFYDMVKPVWDDIGEIPSEGKVNWVATWKYGREKQKGKGRYQDLVSLAPGG